MTSLPFPLKGSTLIMGPSNVGKTTLTATALRTWLDANGSDGVIVFEFGPEYEHGGRILGRRLSRFSDIPEGVWQGVLDAHAPRAAGATDAESVALAADNAARAADTIAAAPAHPTAVFVNDATIPFQHEHGDLDGFLAYCDRAGTVVMNAFDSDELGAGDPVSSRERAALSELEAWADRIVRLNPDE